MHTDAVLELTARRDRALQISGDLIDRGPQADDFGAEVVVLDLEIARTPATTAAGRLAQAERARAVAGRVEDLDSEAAALLITLAGYVDAASSRMHACAVIGLDHPDHPDAPLFAAIARHAELLREEAALRGTMPGDGDPKAQDRWHDRFERYARAECEFLTEVVFGRPAQTLEGARALMQVWLREFPRVDGAHEIARAFELPVPESSIGQ